MEEKKAFVNAVFNTMEAVDGAKKTTQAYKDNTNKYDDLMGTKLVKTPKTMGGQNAVVSKNNIIPPNKLPKTASEELSYIYKEAKFDKNTLNNVKTVIENFDTKNTQHIKNTVDAVKNKQLMNALHHGAKAIPGTALGAGMIAGSGIGAAKLLKKLDGTDNPQNNVEYNTIGGAISAGMALSAIGNKRMLLPASRAAGLVGSQISKIPMNTIKKTKVGAAVDVFGKNIKDIAAQTNKANNDYNFLGSNIEKIMSTGKSFEEASKAVLDQQINNLKTQNWKLGKTDPEKLKTILEDRTKEINNSFAAIKDLLNKKASDELDGLYKIAGARTQYLQDVVKHKFFKSGLESLPYYAGTAILGHAIDSNIKRRVKDVELYKAKQKYLQAIQEQGLESKEKTASEEAIFFKNPKINHVFKKSLESAVEGVGRMTIPLAASTLIGRDITKSLRKMDRNNILGDGVTTDESSIQLSRKERAEIENMIKNDPAQSKVAEEMPSDSGVVAQKIIRDVEKDILKGDTKLSGEEIHIGNGVKKQFRMAPMHDMHGTHGMVE